MRIGISLGSLQSLLLAGIASGAMMAAVTAAQAQTQADGYIFTPVNDPAGSSGDGTAILGINNAGQMVGTVSSYYNQSGFVYTNGTFAHSGTIGINQPSAFAINDSGQVLVSSWPSVAVETNGSYSYISPVPGAKVFGTGDINDAGEVVGTLDGVVSGYLVVNGFSDIGGKYTIINLSNYGDTNATGVNNAGQIVGYYYGPGEQGFLDTNGTFANLVDPGTTGTFPMGINDNGVIVGYTTGSSGTQGFVFSNGTYTTVDAPGALSTYLTGINDSGTIVGYYSGVPGYFDDGFIATPGGVTPDGATLPVMGGTVPGGLLLLGWLGHRPARRRTA